MLFSVFIHCALVLIIPHRLATASPEFQENARAICSTLALAGLLTSMYWTTLKMPRAPDSSRFNTELIIALALSEISSLAGLFLFFIRHNAQEFWPFAIGSFLAQMLFILPRVMRRDD